MTDQYHRPLLQGHGERPTGDAAMLGSPRTSLERIADILDKIEQKLANEITHSQIRAATNAVIDQWQASNNPAGSYLNCEAVAIAALKAAKATQ